MYGSSPVTDVLSDDDDGGGAVVGIAQPSK